MPTTTAVMTAPTVPPPPLLEGRPVAKRRRTNPSKTRQPRNL
jgi:hypothetical protein